MADDFRPPWEQHHPEHTAERVGAIADLIVKIRAEKLLVRHPRDIRWNLACDMHVWLRDELHAKANGEWRDWLFMETEPNDLDVEFRIGSKSSPVFRIFRPEAAGQPGRTLRGCGESDDNEEAEFEEFRKLPQKVESVLRFAVYTTPEFETRAVEYQQLNLDGKAVYRWRLWTADPAIVAIEDVTRPEAVHVDEPEVLLEEEKQEREEAANNDDDAIQDGA